MDIFCVAIKKITTAISGKSLMTEKDAATIVQKKWRGYIARQKVKLARAEELEFIGMVPIGPKPDKQTETGAAQKVEEKRRERLITHEIEYQRALVDIKQNLIETKGPEIREQLQDQIRQWFIECRDNSGKFPDYPAEEDGGSAKVYQLRVPLVIFCYFFSQIFFIIRLLKTTHPIEFLDSSN